MPDSRYMFCITYGLLTGTFEDVAFGSNIAFMAIACPPDVSPVRKLAAPECCDGKDID